MLVLRWDALLFSYQVALLLFSSVRARSVQRPIDEAGKELDLERKIGSGFSAPLGQPDSTVILGPHPAVLSSRSRISTEIIVRRYVVSTDNPLDRIAGPNQVFTRKDVTGYSVAAKREPFPPESDPMTTTSCTSTTALPTSTFGTSFSNAAPSTTARDIAIILGVFLFICLIGTILLVRHARRKMANASDAETTSKPGGPPDLVVTPFTVPPSANQHGHGSVAVIDSVSKFKAQPIRVSNGDRTKLFSARPSPLIIPSSATRPEVLTPEIDSPFPKSAAGQEHTLQRDMARLHRMQEEMMTLQANMTRAQSRGITPTSPQAGDVNDSDRMLREMREMIRDLGDQMADLQEQHRLVVATPNPLVEPPPGYQPSPLPQTSEGSGSQDTK